MVQYIQCENSETTWLDQEWLILHTSNFTITKLNELGGFCWSLLREAQSVDSIIEAVQANYNTIEEITKNDIEKYLLDLDRCGLIQYVV
ncbi:PqqD family protein [Bacillus sp. JJ634]